MRYLLLQCPLCDDGRTIIITGKTGMIFQDSKPVCDRCASELEYGGSTDNIFTAEKWVDDLDSVERWFREAIQ